MNLLLILNSRNVRRSKEKVGAKVNVHMYLQCLGQNEFVLNKMNSLRGIRVRLHLRMM